MRASSEPPKLCGPHSITRAWPCGQLSKQGLPFLPHPPAFKMWVHDYCLTRNVNGSDVYPGWGFEEAGMPSLGSLDVSTSRRRQL